MGGAGNGLAGLAERVATLGGQCDAGPLPGGGFRLSVLVPIEHEGGTSVAAVPGAGIRIETVKSA